MKGVFYIFFFFSSRRRHTRLQGDWSSDVCSSDLRSRGRPWCRFRPSARHPRHWDCCTRSAWRRASAVPATPERLRLARPPRSRPHCAQPSQPTRERGPRWALPEVARVLAPEWRLFVTKWRQILPHTAQSPARTLLLPDACPTSSLRRCVLYLTSEIALLPLRCVHRTRRSR